MSLLPFALFWLQNSPYTLGLTPFEIIYARPPPLLPNLKSETLVEFGIQRFLSSPQAHFQVHKLLRPQLYTVYDKVPPPSQHEYHPNELVIIKRHRKETLEPSWKGPYIVILTTPTVVMGNGLPVWIYHLHANSEDYALETTWDLWKAVAHP